MHVNCEEKVDMEDLEKYYIGKRFFVSQTLTLIFNMARALSYV